MRHACTPIEHRLQRDLCSTWAATCTLGVGQRRQPPHGWGLDPSTTARIRRYELRKSRRISPAGRGSSAGRQQQIDPRDMPHDGRGARRSEATRSCGTLRLTERIDAVDRRADDKRRIPTRCHAPNHTSAHASQCSASLRWRCSNVRRGGLGRWQRIARHTCRPQHSAGVPTDSVQKSSWRWVEWDRWRPIPRLTRRPVRRQGWSR